MTSDSCYVTDYLVSAKIIEFIWFFALFLNLIFAVILKVKSNTLGKTRALEEDKAQNDKPEIKYQIAGS